MSNRNDGLSPIEKSVKLYQYKVGRNIKALIQFRHKDENDLSDSCGFTKKTLSNIKIGANPQNIMYIDNIAKYLDTPFHWILSSDIYSKFEETNVNSSSISYDKNFNYQNLFPIIDTFRRFVGQAIEDFSRHSGIIPKTYYNYSKMPERMTSTFLYRVSNIIGTTPEKIAFLAGSGVEELFSMIDGEVQEKTLGVDDNSNLFYGSIIRMDNPSAREKLYNSLVTSTYTILSETKSP